MDHEPTTVVPSGPPPDLDAVAADLAAVESALAKLDDGTYWTDPVAGAAGDLPGAESGDVTPPDPA